MAIAPDQLRRPRQLSQIVDAAISLYRQNFGEFLAIAAVALPLDVVAAVVPVTISNRVASLIATVLIYIPVLVVNIIVTAAIARAIADVADGQPADFNRAYRQVLDRLGTLLLAALRVIGITLLLAMTIIGIPFAIYLGIRWFFIAQAVVIENTKSGDALSLSADIVKGSWWRTFGIVIIVSLLAAIPSFSVGALFAWAAPVASALISAVIATIVRPFTAGAFTLLFFDLSSRESEHVSVA
jgi:hypothetical protein